jgi:hypothetical protein
MKRTKTYVSKRTTHGAFLGAPGYVIACGKLARRRSWITEDVEHVTCQRCLWAIGAGLGSEFTLARRDKEQR